MPKEIPLSEQTINHELTAADVRVNSADAVLDRIGDLEKHAPARIDTASSELVQSAEAGWAAGDVSEPEAESATLVGLLEVSEGGQRTAVAIESTPSSLLDQPLHDIAVIRGDEVVADIITRVEHAAQQAEATAVGDRIIGDYLADNPYDVSELAEYLDVMPDVGDEVVATLLERLTLSDQQAAAKVLQRFPALSANTELMQRYFKQPQAMAELANDRPATLAFMSKHILFQGRRMLSAAQLFDETTDSTRRARMIHNSEVILDTNATPLAKNMAHTILKLSPASNLAEISYGEVAFGYIDKYLPEQNVLTTIPIPLATRLPNQARQVGDIPQKSLLKMTDDERRLCLKPEFIAAHSNASGDIDVSNASLADLQAEFQELVLAERVEHALEQSNSDTAKQAAIERNRALVVSGEPFIKAGDLVHTTYPQKTEAIIKNGLVCGELLGPDSDADAFPFNVDFYKVDRQAAEAENVMRSVSPRINNYEDRLGSVTFVLNRSEQSQHDYPEREAVPGELSGHSLILGAVPSTECKAIVVHDNKAADTTRTTIEQQLANQGIYIPIIDERGALLFTYEDFATIRPEVGVTEPLNTTEVMPLSGRDIPPWERVNRFAASQSIM